MTPEERHLWYDFLKSLPKTIRRQKVSGEIIVDFCCEEAKLVIEIDGIQHETAEGQETDRLRDEYLRKRGYTVVRYTNQNINNNFSVVCKDLIARLEL